MLENTKSCGGEILVKSESRSHAGPTAAASLAEICMSLMEHQVERKFAIQMEAGIVQRISARIVRAIGGSGDDEAARKAAWKRAERIVHRAVAKKPKPQEEADREVAAILRSHLEMTRQALGPVTAFRDSVEERMREFAKKTPVTGTIEATPGFNLLGVAVIIGEAGDLNRYSTVRKLWRRLGLGMAPGHEAHAYSTWKWLGLPADEWERAGYSPKRLGQIYGVVTVPLVMHKSKSRYGAIYEARRAHTAIMHPTVTSAECKADPIRWTPSHSAMDAGRVITKALIADLWSEWRRGSPGVLQACDDMAFAAQESDAAA
jgi:hypothetical protein